MSFKRPTEVSWDSDEDEELLSINTKFKGDDDEELDEDALLGSDEELCQSSLQSVPQTSKTASSLSEKTPTKGTGNKNATNRVISTITTNRNGTPGSKTTAKKEESMKRTPKTTPASKMITRTSQSTEKTKKTITPIVFSEPEPVLLLDPEESYDFDESGMTESFFESSQSEGTEDDPFVKPQVVRNIVPISRTDEEEIEDQSDISSMEVSVDRGQDSSEESDESDKEDDRRGRFRTERQGTVNLTSHKPVADIPDTLEISKEQEKEIEQFLQHGQKRSHKFNRGRGGGRFPNYPQRRGMGNRAPLSSQSINHSQVPPSYSHQAPPQSAPDQSPSKPQKIHINPHFRRGAMPHSRNGDGLMPSPTVPPQYRSPGPPSLTQLQHPAPVVHSSPQSGPWTSQATPQPMYSSSHHHHPPHHVQAPPVHLQYPGQQTPPRPSVPYPAYSRGPPPHPHPHPAPQPLMGHYNQAPRSGPTPFHGQQFPPHSQYHPSRPPPPQPLMTPSHRYPPAQQPPQPLIRAEPPPHVRMAPPSQQGHNIPPPPRHYIQQEYSQQRYPPPGRAPEPFIRHDFQPRTQAQQPPRFQQRAPGYQNQARPHGFHSQGQRMPRNPNQNNGGPRQPVLKAKQNSVLLAHVKKLTDRAKKFGQTTPVGATKPQKRASTEETIIDASPVKQSKVEIEQLTPEDRELQAKLALQARQRELIRKRKEANRQALAQKKREQLTQRLAEKGQTIDDVEQLDTPSLNQIKTVQTTPKKVQQPIQPPRVGPQIKTLNSNQVRFPNAQVAHSVQTNAQKTIGNIRASKPINKTATNQTLSAKTAGSNKKLMKRIETVKKNAQGDIISREIKLVPIEDEADASEETSLLKHGKVQVIKNTAPVSPIGGQQTGNRTVVSGNSGNRSVISPGLSPRSGNRAVVRINPVPGDNEEGDQRNVVSQQGTNRRIVVTSKPKKVMVKNLSVSTSDVMIKNLCTTVGPVESIERAENDALVTFIDGKHAALFAQKYNRTLLDLSTILVSLVRY
ncbi:RNA-binding protein 33-like isoform X2 [Ostrea edulis]|uniref:RNA-binding protein 33-like isoform X2 n=1 Tax=Ostrea edulis TaxID=37623 RepID=UPI0024AFE788|nr:RNA-binding protein 33-like isoform X2 [Ostrea edulis]XP_055998486.1 RNA-binding protein 33-like isoform X2 [Ostrea edulis]